MVSGLGEGGRPRAAWPGVSGRHGRRGSDLREIDGEMVELRRNPRRRRNAVARREDGLAIVELPVHIPVAEEDDWLRMMLARLRSHETRRRQSCSDERLMERARHLHATYLAPALRHARVPTSVTWVENQDRRWGSCTPANGTIRLSSRLKDFPQWVVDYVLLHELAHLVEAGHGAAFSALMEAYPRNQEAKGYLAGYSAGRACRDYDGWAGSPLDEDD